MPHYGSFTMSLCFLSQGLAPAFPRFLLTSLDSQFLFFFETQSPLTRGSLNGSLCSWPGFRRPVNPLKTNLISCMHLRMGIVSYREGTELLSGSVVGSGPQRGQQGSKSTSCLRGGGRGPVTPSALSTSSRLAVVEPGLEPQIG